MKTLQVTGLGTANVQMEQSVISRFVPAPFGGIVDSEPDEVVRVMFADDHPALRRGLRMVLETSPGIELVGEANNGKVAVEMAKLLKPDVILMDMFMPVMDGIDACRAIKAFSADIEVIIFTSVVEDQKVFDAVRAGAMGYLLKEIDEEPLIKCIMAAAHGEVQLHPEAAKRLMKEVRMPDSPEKLTERETEVLRLLAKGMSNKEISSRLSVSEKTVKTHVSNVLAKLHLPSRTQAALYAINQGIVSSGPYDQGFER